MVKTSPFHGGITGSNPVGVIFIIWRITQVRLKGSVLKTDRWLTPRGGSNPSSSLYHYRGVEQLAARRAHNPEVVGSSPTPAIYYCWCILSATNKRQFLKYKKKGAVAQLVEQRIEAPCVGSSTLSCAIL